MFFHHKGRKYVANFIVIYQRKQTANDFVNLKYGDSSYLSKVGIVSFAMLFFSGQFCWFELLEVNFTIIIKWLDILVLNVDKIPQSEF